MNIEYTKEKPTITFHVDMDPVGKQRPRFNGKTHHTYTPKKTVDAEKQIRAAYLKESGGYRFPDNTPLAMTVIAYYPVPQSASKKQRSLMLERSIFPSKKPDWDNIGKLVADAINGIAYDDDKSIVNGTVVKRYASHGGITVVLTEHKEDVMPKNTKIIETEEK